MNSKYCLHQEQVLFCGKISTLAFSGGTQSIQHNDTFSQQSQSSLYMTLGRCEWGEGKKLTCKTIYICLGALTMLYNICQNFKENRTSLLCAMYTVPGLWCFCLWPFICTKLSGFKKKSFMSHDRPVKHYFNFKNSWLYAAILEKPHV